MKKYTLAVILSILLLSSCKSKKAEIQFVKSSPFNADVIIQNFDTGETNVRKTDTQGNWKIQFGEFNSKTQYRITYTRGNFMNKIDGKITDIDHSDEFTVIKFSDEKGFLSGSILEDDKVKE